jgi:hypothetical protein
MKKKSKLKKHICIPREANMFSVKMYQCGCDKYFSCNEYRKHLKKYTLSQMSGFE